MHATIVFLMVIVTYAASQLYIDTGIVRPLRMSERREGAQTIHTRELGST